MQVGRGGGDCVVLKGGCGGMVYCGTVQSITATISQEQAVCIPTRNCVELYKG